MRIIKTEIDIIVRMSEEELLNLYGAVLSTLAKHKKQYMPVTRNMAEIMSEYFLKKPF